MGKMPGRVLNMLYSSFTNPRRTAKELTEGVEIAREFAGEFLHFFVENVIESQKVPLNSKK